MGKLIDLSRTTKWPSAFYDYLQLHVVQYTPRDGKDAPRAQDSEHEGRRQKENA